LVLQKEKETGTGAFERDFAWYKIESYTTLFSSIYVPDFFENYLEERYF